MASPRQLAYRDRFVWHLEEIISSIFDDCDDFTDRYVFPDMTTRVPMVMYLSQEQFTTLYSAVLTGADLSYPEKNQDVEYLFLQMLMCPMSQLCQAIADCLLNSEATRDALNQALTELGLTGGVGDPSAPLSETITGANLLPAGYTCTDDKAFGMALAVVEAINDATMEVLQAIEILTNPVEIAAELGDNIPGIAALWSAGDIARWVQNSAHEAYVLAWSTTIRDELACLLWCDFKGGCSLTYDSIFGVYLAAANVSPPASIKLIDWLAWLIALPFVASLSTVATISLLGLLAMRYGGSFGDFQLGIRSMETVINLAQYDSSSDWSTVCDPCLASWCHEFDFTVDDGGWFTGYDACRELFVGTYSAGVGWIATHLPGASGCSSNYKACFAHFTIAASITKMEITYSMDYVSTPAGYNLFKPIPGADEAIPQQDETDNVLTWNGDVSATDLYVQLYPAFNQGDVGSATLKKVRIWGYGYNPFGSSNC